VLTDPVAAEEEVPSFDGPPGRLRFTIDGELFEGPRVLPGVHALQFIARAQRWEAVEADEAAGMLPELFEHVLLPESLERFRARLADPEHPIGLKQVTELVPWLFARLAQRPSLPPPGSSTGLANRDGGTSLTGEPPAEGSTLPASPSPDSST
jgi:hypothetical protein